MTRSTRSDVSHAFFQSLSFPGTGPFVIAGSRASRLYEREVQRRSHEDNRTREPRNAAVDRSTFHLRSFVIYFVYPCCGCIFVACTFLLLFSGPEYILTYWAEPITRVGNAEQWAGGMSVINALINATTRALRSDTKLTAIDSYSIKMLLRYAMNRARARVCEFQSTRRPVTVAATGIVESDGSIQCFAVWDSISGKIEIGANTIDRKLFCAEQRVKESGFLIEDFVCEIIEFESLCDTHALPFTRSRNGKSCVARYLFRQHD